MRYCLLLLIFLTCNSGFAQNKIVQKRDTIDTVAPKPDFVQMMQEKGKERAVKSLEKYSKGKAAIHRREAIDMLKKISQQAKIFLKEDVDTLGVYNLLGETRKSIDVAKEGIFSDRGTSQTQRNLSASSAILADLSKKIERQKRSLDKYSNKLIDFRVKIDSLYSDPLLYKLSADSVEISKYLDKISVIVKETSPVDSTLNIAIANVQALQLKVDLLAFELQSLKEDIDIYSANLAPRIFTKEFPYLWESVTFRRPFADVVRFSIKKESMVLSYYLNENSAILFFLFILVCAAFYFIRSLKKQVANENKLKPDYSGQFILRYPLLSAILLVFSVFQFIFTNPPYIVSCMIWLITAICLAFIFSKYVTTYWLRVWIVIILFFVLASCSNVVVQITRIERFYTLFLSIAGIVYLSRQVTINKRRRELREWSIPYFVVFAIICQVVSILLNCGGRFNLSKTFFVTGYSGLVIAIVFLWVARLINEGLLLATSVYKQPNRKLFFINFNKIGDETPAFFYVILVSGWFILVARNFYGFRRMYDSTVEFLTEEQTVGHYNFSIMGLIVFFLILVFSLFLSKLVSFFASEQVNSQEKGSKQKKGGLGGYLLIIRIFIICMGLFFAFAAAGIALDKITVIFGALGVGVGLGLQGLVNNLVSGLILSFERPVNVGDLIEIDGKMATMKSLGFRSSIVTSFDGSCIVIPNGELLNHHLVNWTMGSNLKINKFIVGVAFGTDLKTAKALLMKILSEDVRILPNPPFEVVVKDFNSNSIELEIAFWPRRMLLGRVIKSDIILKIDQVFREEGIEIAFPQQDVYIKSLPDPEPVKDKDKPDPKDKQS